MHLACCMMAVRDLTTALDSALKAKRKNGLQGDGEMMPQQVGSGGSGRSGANSNGCQMHTLQRLITHDAMGASRVFTLLMGDKPALPPPSQGSCLNTMIAIWQYKI